MSNSSKRAKRGRHFYGPGPYVERDVDEELLTALRGGDYTMVFAARGSGKTSLRVRTTELLAEEGVRVATVDLDAIGAETRADAFCASLVIEAGRSLGLAEQAKKAWRRSKGPPSMRLRACFREVLLEPEDTPLVLFIDELDMVRALGPARDDFFSALRAMADARGHDPVWRRLSLCLIGAITRDELISDPGRAAFDLSAREFSPRDFSREQLEQFADTLAPLEVNTKALLDALYEWTSGNPALVQWICGDLLLREVERGNEATVVEALIRETFLQRGPEVDPLLGDTARRLRRERRDPYRTRMLAAYERVLRGEIIDLRGRALGSEGPLIVARLKVAGLVAPSAGAKLRVRNRIVERAFDRNWVRRSLAGRPVSDALERWEAGGHRSAHLLRGEALRSAVEWIEGRPDVTPSERDFVIASERARSRRLRGLTWAGGALSLGLGVILGVLAWQLREATEAPQVAVVDGSAAPSTPPETEEHAGKAELESGPEGETEGPEERGPAFVSSARQVVEQASGNAELEAQLASLETELAALEQRLAIERAARAELLAPDPARRAEGLDLALGALSTWVEAGSSLDDVPAPVTRGLSANLASPGDTRLISAHAGPVEGVWFSADGTSFATRSEAEIRVWERDTGRRLASLTNIAGAVTHLALSPSGRRVAALSKEGGLTVWNLADGSALGPAPIGAPLGAPMPLAPVASLTVDEGGNIGVIRRDGSLDTVDPRAGNASARLQASALPSDLPLDHAVVIDPGLGADTRVAVVLGEKIELWDASEGQAQASVSAPALAEGRVEQLLAAPEAAELILQLAEATELLLWDPSSGTLRGVAAQDEAISRVALSPEGELLATSAGEDRSVRVWSIESGALLTTIESLDEPPSTLAFTPDGAALVIGDRGGQVRVHPLALGGDPSLPVRAAALGAGGVAATVHHDEAALELRWSGGQTSARWPLQHAVVEAALSVDGSRLALRYADGSAALLSGAAGPEGEPLARFEPRVLDLALSTDGELLALALEDRRVSLVAGDGRAIATLAGHEAPVDRLALSPEGNRLVSADRSGVVRVWDPQTAALLGTFELEHRPEHLAIEGERFVLIDPQGSAELWSTQTRARVAELELGSEAITGVALSPEGDALALGRAGGVELWRPSSSEAIARFRALAPVTALRFLDDGQTLLAVDGRGQLARWPAQPEAWVAEACALLAPGSVVPSVCGEGE